MCETQTAKHAKMPVVNAFMSMIGRRTQTHRTSSASTTIPTAAPEGATADISKGTLPTMASIERERAPKMKLPTKSGVHSGGGKRKSVEPNISVDKRLVEYPGQGFVKFQNSLRCTCCHHELSLIKSSIENHVGTEKHKGNLKNMQTISKADSNLAGTFTSYCKEYP